MFKKFKEENSEHTTYIYESKNKMGWKPPVFNSAESELLLKHIERYIGKPSYAYHEIFSDTVHIDIYHIEPSEERNYHTFVTMGMSSMPMNVPKGQEEWKFSELMICLPADWKVSDKELKDNRNYWPLGLLKMLARFPHEYGTWLSWGHTMPNGEPPQHYADNTKFCGIILLPPILVNEEFIKLKVNRNKTINFFAVIPLYKEEIDYKLEHGYNSFIEKYAEFDMDELIRLNRKNFGLEH
ncbi:suppressor of fused domain protein [Acetivibrio clariflavus]|nr:suppressor of fused domain protein [Acetivibrio clariflavus]